MKHVLRGLLNHGNFSHKQEKIIMVFSLTSVLYFSMKLVQWWRNLCCYNMAGSHTFNRSFVSSLFEVRGNSVRKAVCIIVVSYCYLHLGLASLLLKGNKDQVNSLRSHDYYYDPEGTCYFPLREWPFGTASFHNNEMFVWACAIMLPLTFWSRKVMTVKWGRRE